MNSSARPTAHAVATLAIAAPWLNPFASGPSPPVQQWLFTGLCAAVLLLWLALQQPERGELARATASGWLLAALASSAIGLVQYFGAADAFAPWVNGTGAGEAFANLRQRNQFATLTSIGLTALLWWQAQGPISATESVGHARHAGLLFMAALLALGNAASSSRTGMVQLLLLVNISGAGSPFTV